jgi:O-acetylhomoserine (thiol)-lyase
VAYDAHSDQDLAFDTLQLHAGYDPAGHNGSKAVPVYQTAAFELGDFDRCVRLFNYEEDGHSYVRFSNPTNEVLEKRMAALEGGAASVCFASGMSAISGTLLNLARAGDEIAAVKTLYGGTANLLADVLPDYGIATRWVADPADLDAYAGAITPRTKAICIESLGNPSMNVIDIEAVAGVAHEHGVPLVVDGTFATPYLLRPFDSGADIVCHSSTKYISGHGTTIGGIVVEKGGFDWRNGRFPQFEKFLEENASFIETGALLHTAFTRRLRMRYLTEFGGHMSPMTAFLTLNGVETLSLRMQRHAENALKVAAFLEGHPAVLEVAYPSLPSSPHHALAAKYVPRGSGAIIGVRVRGGLAAGRRVLERVRIFDYMVNVGDTKSLIVHPATSIHHGLAVEEQERAGVFEDTLRLSVGTEDAGDLIRDLDQALEGAAPGQTARSR